MTVVKATLDTRKGQQKARTDYSAAYELRRAVRVKWWGTVQPTGTHVNTGRRESSLETEVETTQKRDHWGHWEPACPSPSCSLSSSLQALRKNKGKSRLTRTDILFCPPLGPRVPETQATSLPLAERLPVVGGL